MKHIKIDPFYQALPIYVAKVYFINLSGTLILIMRINIPLL